MLMKFLIKIQIYTALRLLGVACFLFYSTICLANEVETLATSPEWLKLLHYHQKTFGGYEGLVENDDFYVAENGRNNPLAELNAEIEDFAEETGKKCEFPARFEFFFFF